LVVDDDRVDAREAGVAIDRDDWHARVVLDAQVRVVALRRHHDDPVDARGHELGKRLSLAARILVAADRERHHAAGSRHLLRAVFEARPAGISEPQRRAGEWRG